MLYSIRETKEMDQWLQNFAPVVDTTENEALQTLVSHKIRAVLQSLPSSTTTKARSEALTASDTHKQGLQKQTVPAALSGYSRKKRGVLAVTDSVKGH